MSDRSYKGRREDQRLLTGRGRYTDDHAMPGQAHAHFLRADRAHARILGIDVEEARALPGVVAVLTGEDVIAAGWKSPPTTAFFKGVGGSSVRCPFRPALAHGRVRFVGEPVVLIVAETEAIAQDAAELVAVDYEDLPVVIDAAEALTDAAPRLHEELPDNLVFDYEYGDEAATDRAFAEAAMVARASVRAQRVSGNPMEPKSAMAAYDGATESYDLFAPTQSASDFRSALAHVTGLDRDRFRIHAHDVGGAFGVRNDIYPEFIGLMLASRRLGRPVKWTGTRSETISGDHHGRGADLEGELALDRKGRFLGLRVRWTVNLGAYCSSSGPLINTVAAPTSSATSLYNVPVVYGRHRLAFTNTTPTTAYRGAGRPNVAYLWERLVEEAAAKTGIDSVTLRRRNLLRKEQFPVKTPTGATYDSGDPEGLLDAVLEESDWAGFPARRREARRRGRLRGIGLALFLEPSGGFGREEIKIEIGRDGKLSLFTNSGPSGQGHETAFPQLVADVLGLPDDMIELRYNDIAAPAMAGTGSFGSRSLISHGAALSNGAHELVRKAKELAARELEVAETDLTFEAGQYRVAGTDLSIALRTVIMNNQGNAAHPLDTSVGLDTNTSFPSGAHVAEVEIDPETGAVEIVRYIAVDDAGVVYNPVLVEAQLHGGLMQGIGQVLGEEVVYDPGNGQLLSGTFMDYFMPRAHLLPPVVLKDHSVPSPANPLGAKGAGEAGTTGSIPTLANAVLDALKAVNVRALEMPYSPGRVWRAIHQPDAGAPGGVPEQRP